MMRLLELINTGKYAGVVCMDIDRLSRGSSMDSGYITQVLQVNDCKIITPAKIYDLNDDQDEQFTDMKFMFSRYEHKTISKRLIRGRNDSAAEGKFLGSIAPYGYEKVKLKGEKGSTLKIKPDEAEVVRMIFKWYTEEQMGYHAIAHKLNELHIPAMKSEQWGWKSVSNIINNPVYVGKMPWGRMKQKKTFVDGKLQKTFTKWNIFTAIDLSNVEIGKHTIKIEYQDIPFTLALPISITAVLGLVPLVIFYDKIELLLFKKRKEKEK